MTKHLEPTRICANAVDTSRMKNSSHNINALRERPPADTSKPTQKSPNNAISETLTADELLARLKHAFQSDAREIAYGRLKVEQITREAYGDLLSPPRAADDIKAIHEPRPAPFFLVRRHDSEWLLSAPEPTPTYVEGGWVKHGSGLHYKEGGWIWGGGRRAQLPDIEAPQEPGDEAGSEETFLQAKCSHLDFVDRGGEIIQQLPNEMAALFDEINSDDKVDEIASAFDNRGYTERPLPNHTRRPVLGRPAFAADARRWMRGDMRKMPAGARERTVEIVSYAARLWLEEHDPLLKQPLEKREMPLEKLAERWLFKTIRRISRQRWFWVRLRPDYERLPPAPPISHVEARAHEALSWLNQVEDDCALERARQIVWCWLREEDQSQRAFAAAKGLHRTEFRRLIEQYCIAVSDRHRRAACQRALARALLEAPKPKPPLKALVNIPKPKSRKSKKAPGSDFF